MIYWWCFEYVWIFLIFLIKLLNMKHLSIEHWTWTTNILEDHWTNVENISFKASGGQWFRRLSWKRKMFNWKWRRHFGDDGHLWIPCGFAVSSINMPIWIHKTMIFFWDMGQPRYLDKESFKHLVFCYIFWYHYIYIYQPFMQDLHPTAKGSGNRCAGPRNRFGSKMAGTSSHFEGSMLEANLCLILIIYDILIYFVGTCFQTISKEVLSWWNCRLICLNKHIHLLSLKCSRHLW